MNDKDQAAIDHVASVSKHPHAAMIVKWLITGWGVKWKGSKGVIDNPAWTPEHKYELIEPKPAYRVYRKIGCRGTYTLDRYVDGWFNAPLPENCEFVSEWIEYDPPKKWPTPLVERIAAIDIKAAEWIVDHWDDLLADRYSFGVTVGRSASTLHEMFCWKESPQGKEYWWDISNKLGDQ